MGIHYNAFISYRHHPADIKVAEQIHRGLEHYKVPRALKKAKNTKMHLFRDKEELPITSNLSDDITRALENSDFLIVICSTHTRESMWVQREIETFLQTHDHNRVLTVLVDGEPYETIPEILCSKEQTDPVTGEKRLIPIEPLSCDWRVGRRKARREELPRLAAALLGCGYDELRQRERQYRTRRLATVLSVALAAMLAFTAYVLYNSMQIKRANEQLEQANIEIRKNLEEAQINQSRYLASASAQQLQAGDRMLAMALALEALPAYEGERPYVAQAELALSDALGAYLANGKTAAVGCISCDALINCFEATDSRDRMFVFDQRYVLSVWDLNTCKKLAAVQLESGLSNMLVTSADHLILLCDHTVKCYDRDLNLLWQTQDCNEMVLSDSRDVLILEKKANTVEFLDAATGAPVHEPVQVLLQPEHENGGWAISFRQETYNLAQPLMLEYSKFGQEKYIACVNLESGTAAAFAMIPESYDIRCTGVTAGGNVLVMSAGEKGMWNGMFGQMMTHSQVPIRIECFSPRGEQLWKSELSTYSYSSERTIYEIPYAGKLFCQVDNMLLVLDASTGEILTQTETGANPVWVQPYETYALALLEDGSLGSLQYDGDDFNSTRYFKEGIDYGFAGKGVFVKQNLSTQILAYSVIMDKNWQTFSGEYTASVNSAAVSAGHLAVYNNDAVMLFDTGKQKLLWSIEEESGMHLRILGFSDDGQKLWLSNSGAQIICADVQTGAQERYELPAQMEDGALYYSYYYSALMNGGVIYMQAENLNTNACCVVAFDTADCQSVPIPICKPEDTFYDGETGILAAGNGRVFFWENTEKKLYEANIATGQVRTVLENAATRPVVQLLDDGKTGMMAVEDTVTFYEGSSVLFEAKLEDLKGVSAFRTEEEIILLMDSGDFLRFDLTGKRLGEVAGHQYTSFFSNVSYGFGPEEITWFQTGDGDLFVNVFNSGNLINTDTWELRAWVPNCVAYLPDLDMFVTTGEDPDTNRGRIGMYPRYTVEQIKEMAWEALGEYTLTQEQKEQYGIS